MQRLRVGDRVVVISGKNKGQEGRLAKIDRDLDTVIVEGVNLVSKHQKPSPKNPQGGIVKKEAAIRSCKVMPIDPQTGKATRVKIAVVEGKKVRQAKSGATLTTEA